MPTPAAANFKALLGKRLDDVKRPDAWPPGTYHGQIEKYTTELSSKKRTPFVRFHLKTLSAGEDVDQALLEGIVLTKKPLHADFYLTESSEYRLKELYIKLGIDDAGRTHAECLAETIGKMVQYEVGLEQSQDGESFYNPPEVKAITREGGADETE